jgi:hypothetical protein
MSASPTPNHESSCGAVTWATRRSRSTSAVGRDRLQRVFTHHAVPPRPVAREQNCAGCGALQFRLRKQSGLTGAGVVPAAGGIKTSPRRPTASRGESMTRRKLHFRRGRKVSAQLGNGGLHERPHTRLFPRSRKREGLLSCRRGLPPRGTWNLERFPCSLAKAHASAERSRDWLPTWFPRNCRRPHALAMQRPSSFLNLPWPRGSSVRRRA